MDQINLHLTENQSGQFPVYISTITGYILSLVIQGHRSSILFLLHSVHHSGYNYSTADFFVNAFSENLLYGG